jgi:hypothetical protein
MSTSPNVNQLFLEFPRKEQLQEVPLDVTLRDFLSSHCGILHISENKYVVPTDFFADNAVPDVVRYLVSKEGSKFSVKPISNDRSYSRLTQPNSIWNDYLATDAGHIGKSCPDYKGNICLVIESPHDEEYDYEPDFAAKAPAQGKTGAHLHKKLEGQLNVLENENAMQGHYLAHELLDNLENGLYTLIICNPVPYQTSLHYYHRQSLKARTPRKTLRDQVWKVLFKTCQLRSSFATRIESYDPVLILNCCTRNSAPLERPSSSTLLELAREAVPTGYPIITSYCHPVGWNTRSNINFWKVIEPGITTKWCN